MNSVLQKLSGDGPTDGKTNAGTDGWTLGQTAGPYPKEETLKQRKKKKENCQESGNERKWRKNQCEKLKVELDTSLHDCALYRGVR